jgi:hypothetical protein
LQFANNNKPQKSAAGKKRALTTIVLAVIVSVLVIAAITASSIYILSSQQQQKQQSSEIGLTLLAQSTTNSTLGLKFTLTVNTTTVQSGQGINISSSIYNVRSAENNVTGASEWALSNLNNYTSQPVPCPSYAYFQIFQGYFTQSNISSAKDPLQLSPPGLGLPCTGGKFSYYVLQPQSNLARSLAGTPPPTYITLPMGFSRSINETYNSPTNANTVSTSPLHPSVYTIAGGDEWGQLVILYFTVASSSSSTS